MKLPRAKVALEILTVFSASTIAVTTLLWLMGSSEQRFSHFFSAIGLALGVVAILLSLMGVGAGIEHILRHSRSKLLHGGAMTLFAIGTGAACLFMLWGLWNYVTDWMWAMPLYDTPRCL